MMLAIILKFLDKFSFIGAITMFALAMFNIVPANKGFFISLIFVIIQILFIFLKMKLKKISDEIDSYKESEYKTIDLVMADIISGKLVLIGSPGIVVGCLFYDEEDRCLIIQSMKDHCLKKEIGNDEEVSLIIENNIKKLQEETHSKFYKNGTIATVEMKKVKVEKEEE